MPGLTATKLSILLLYNRIFPNRSLRIASWCIGSLTVLILVVSEIVPLLECIPLQALWNPTVTSPRCINFNAWIVTHGTFSVVTDWIVLLMPIPLVWKLKMARTRKIQVMGIFMLGGLYVTSANHMPRRAHVKGR